MHRKQAWSKRVKKERFKRKYLTRMQATRLLQVDSINFRRLCILKGIYPRAITHRSKQKQSGNDKQYYLAKEMKWLVRDHIPDRVMAFRAWEKKVRRATAMGSGEDLKLLQSAKIKPSYSLVPTIKERYPRFIDAVKDIDDAMTNISLYAFLSPEINSKSTIELHHSLPSGLHDKAKAIVAQWNDYVARAQILNKGFISIKGYYFEAIVKGERVRWLAPHEYASKFPSGIQQYILITFLEFYVEMMRFVLFKLEADHAKEVAEQQRREDDEAAAGVAARADAEDFTSGAGAAAAASAAPAVVMVGEHQTAGVAAQRDQAERAAGMQRELAKVRRVFENLSFYFSREVPAKHLTLIVRACGGRVVSEYNPAAVTHYVVDRPALAPPHVPVATVEYVQPQYLFDCMNARALLPVVGYRIGETLPPHVSPFTVSISNSKDDVAAVEEAKRAHPKIVGYVPERVHEIRKFLDPSYTSLDPTGKVAAALEADYSSGDEHVEVGPEMDGDDVVSLDDDEARAARRAARPEWKDEKVAENVERSALSAFQVKKQRELNLMNAPTREGVAARRQAAARRAEEARKGETDEQRVKRKLRDVAKQEKATKKMQLQVARKKAARFYRMVNGVVEGNARKEKILAAKAANVKQGRTVAAPDGKGLESAAFARKRDDAAKKGEPAPIKKKVKAADPYRRLPKHVR